MSKIKQNAMIFGYFRDTMQKFQGFCLHINNKCVPLQAVLILRYKSIEGNNEQNHQTHRL